MARLCSKSEWRPKPHPKLMKVKNWIWRMKKFVRLERREWKVAPSTNHHPTLTQVYTSVAVPKKVPERSPIRYQLQSILQTKVVNSRDVLSPIIFNFNRYWRAKWARKVRCVWNAKFRFVIKNKKINNKHFLLDSAAAPHWGIFLLPSPFLHSFVRSSVTLSSIYSFENDKWCIRWNRSRALCRRLI